MLFQLIVVFVALFNPYSVNLKITHIHTKNKSQKKERKRKQGGKEEKKNISSMTSMESPP